jgi:hypothetical protein
VEVVAVVEVDPDGGDDRPDRDQDDGGDADPRSAPS